jgi:rhomboid protease GluP
MHSDRSPLRPPSDIGFNVIYHEFALRSGAGSAADLAHQGTLVIRGEGAEATFTFSGANRPKFRGAMGDLTEFRADQIANVYAQGRTIEFLGSGGPAIQRTQHFTFYTTNDEDTAAIARLLPKTRDADALAEDEFIGRVRQLPVSRSPWTSVTGTIVIVNIAVFLFMGTQGAGWIQPESMAPYLRYGANNGGFTAGGQWWRLLTSMFLHYGVIHLAMNMWTLFQAGLLLERLLGRTLYLLVYLGSGVLGGIVSILWNGDKAWSAGASGAVFGVYGAVLGYMLREKDALPKTFYKSTLKGTLIFAVYNLAFGLMIPRIDNSAHIGGLLAGLGLGWLVALPVDLTARTRLYGRRLGVGALVLAVAVVGGAVAARLSFTR